MTDFSKQHCVPCEGGVPPTSKVDAQKMMEDIPEWVLSEDPSTSLGTGSLKISRDFKFKNFQEALSFVNKVGELAEAEGHHPDITILYNKVKLDLSTHAIGGLSENDFILAAKINQI